MTQKQRQIIYGVLATAVVVMFAFGGYLVYRQQDNRKETTEKNASAPAAEAVETPAPVPTKDPHLGQVRSTMTGQWIDEKIENQRAFAVMINNIEYAFKNQMGTSKADIVYEALAEGGITRMMAVYQDVCGVKKSGSVRSARHYYVQFAAEWDAVFCHFGHTKYAVSKMKKLKTENVSGLSGIGPVAYARTNTLVAPHNVFTSGSMLRKGAKKLGYSLKKKGTRAAHFSFYEQDTEPAYYKKQLSFKNVIIQLVDESNIDRNGYQTMKLTNNSGKGYYFTDGKQTAITWERREKGNIMEYRDSSGNVLAINPGKTYIAVYPQSRKKLIQVKG